MILRLLTGLWMASRLRKASTAIPALVATSRPIAVLECPRIRVPLTLGWFRPKILLPPDWANWTPEKLQAVLTHERTHVSRADYAVALLAEINRSLYWFHPLAWWLKDHLSNLAEEACDDAAINSTGDRARYAGHLLEVAAAVSKQRGRVVAAGVSMARRPQVETRINAILDFTRPLSRRMTFATTLLLLAAIVPIIALAAALRPADSRQDDVPAAIADTSPSVDTQATEETKATVPADSIDEAPTAAAASKQVAVVVVASESANATYHFAGTLVDPEGKPVAGAKIALSYLRNSRPADDPARVALTDDNGRFEFNRKKSAFSDSGRILIATDADLIATKDGFGFACAPAVYFESTGRLDAELTDQFRLRLEQTAGAKTNILKLAADDVPVRGRVVDIEGKAVPGATVEVVNVWAGKDETLDAWEAAVKEPGIFLGASWSHLRLLMAGSAGEGMFNWMGGGGDLPASRVYQEWSLLGGSRPLPVSAVRTDVDGRFTLKGIGRERIAEFVVSGPGIETTQQFSRSRPGEVVKVPLSNRSDFGVETFNPCEFTVVAGPSAYVAGRITDKNTNAPLVGVRVQSTSQLYTRTVTDADGKYRLDGLRLGGSSLFIVPPDGSRHLAGGVTVKLAAQAKSVVRDITLTAGVLVRGRTIDERTGKPVSGQIEYLAYRSNPGSTQSDSLRPLNLNRLFQPDTDGRFEIPVLPGQGFLGFMAGAEFPMGVGADRIDCARYPGGGESIVFETAPNLCHASQYNLLVPVNPQPQDNELAMNLTLRSGTAIPGHVLSPGNEPLADYTIYGLHSRAQWQKNPGESFTLYGYFPTDVRRLMVYHPGQDLAGHLEVTGEPPEKLEIKLRPAATLVGRVVDADGLPVENAEVSTPRMMLSQTNDPRDIDRGVLQYNINGRIAATDAEGRFELKGIIPGLKYTAGVRGMKMLGDKNLLLPLGTIFTDVIAEPGETKQLGDVRPKPDKPGAEKMAIPTRPKTSEQSAASRPALDPPVNGGKDGAPSPLARKAEVGAAKADGDTTVTISGIVLTPDGRPAAGATVRAAALRVMMKEIVGHDFQTPMPETIADAQGRFAISFPKEPFGDVSRLNEQWRQIWKKTTIGASLEGYGPAWVQYDEIPPGQAATLRLVEDVPIRGRVIDLEGRPVAGTVVKIGEPHSSKDEDLSAWLEGVKAGELPWTVHTKAPRSVEQRLVSLPTSVTTGRDGTIEIRGLGRERFVSLIFEGETVAHRGATVVTRTMEPLQRIISQPPFEGSDPVLGAEFTFTADPARTVEGVVRDAKTGEVMAGVAVESYKLVGYPYSDHRVLKSKTDKAGRFRLVGMPKGAGNKLLLLPNDDQPYFMSEVDVPDPVGLGPAQMEIELHRGLWITGRVTDKATGEPVPAVRMHYLPFRSNEYAQKTPEFDANGNVDGDQLRYQTKADGTYRLVGLPGRAIVGADSVMQDYRRGAGYDEIDAPREQKTNYLDTYRNPLNPSPKWPSMMREVNPAADAASVALDFQLDSGQSVRIRVAGPRGEPLTGLSVTGLLWYGYVAATEDPLLTATNFGPDETRTMLFHHKDMNVGRVVTVGPDEIRAGEITVELQPCATAVGRILNDDGAPVSGMSIRPDILPSGDFSPQLANVATDAQGRFRVTLLPGCRYHLAGEGGEFQIVTVAKDVSIEPGETKDLGRVTFDKNGKPIADIPAAETSNTDNPKADSQEKEVPAQTKPPEEPKTSATKNSVTTPIVAETKAQSPPLAQPPPKTPVAKTNDRDQVVVRGVVLDPDGKPFAGAIVYALGWYWSPDVKHAPLAEGRSGPDGRFEISFRHPNLLEDVWHYRMAGRQQTIAALADGFGAGFNDFTIDSGDNEQALRLVRDDVPITGRVLDLEGRPVAGVKVTVGDILAFKDDDLTAWLESIRLGESRNTGRNRLSQRRLPGYETPSNPAVVTDVDGRFQLTGIGRERAADVVLEGPTIARTEATIVTRKIPPTGEVQGPDFRTQSLLFGADCQITVVPTRPIIGTVRDAETGKPLAGVTVVNSSWVAGVRGDRLIRAVTDLDGRYQLMGLPKVKGIEISTVPNDDQPYFAQSADVDESTGFDPIHVDFEMHRGIWITGRITDKATGDPVPAHIYYLPFRSNEYAQRRTPEFKKDGNVQGSQQQHTTGRDGTYRLVGLPGAAIIGAECISFPYRTGVGAEVIGGQDEYGHFPTYRNPAPPSPKWPNNMRKINPPEGVESATCDLQLDPGETIRIAVADSDGVPLVGCVVEGRTARFDTPAPLEQASDLLI